MIILSNIHSVQGTFVLYLDYNNIFYFFQIFLNEVIKIYSNLTNKQTLILEFIKKEKFTKGYPPSVREICDAVGLKSTSTVHSHLNKLENLGYIRRDPSKPRTLEILDNPYDIPGLNQELIPVPVISKITAGEPILAIQNIEEYIPLPISLIRGKNNFILRVNGDSMMNAGIHNKDLVIFDKKKYAEDSQIVVALVNNDFTTVKRFFKEGNKIRLQPENDFMDPIILDKRNVEIIGIVRGVFRV